MYKPLSWGAGSGLALLISGGAAMADPGTGRTIRPSPINLTQPRTPASSEHARKEREREKPSRGKHDHDDHGHDDHGHSVSPD